MKEIQMDQLKEKLLSNEPVHVVDVREDEEVALGMIPDAKHIPMQEVPNHLDEFDTNKTYYIVCAAGARSARVVDYLTDHNIDAVNVEGGMKAWGDGGLTYDGI
ncbi:MULTISPECIES: rhodanese-like domain-containing protein [unclassified Staphylococcus]|uniref:rhodanese-like domain-containing protein n=1 Tax=unclassified Staphylococcus TaxID=91994 RepID=UPI0021D03C7B|nr:MULTISPECIES: rhodanese-like domain-containing protein [unclassified Staphylococcus]UXR68885.1 rhodanese-like domain-containing protein [Staphylococcus sp. IVB6246]UXR70942.1 rhodanese-like domain-containing protein [Staphylococcus sp. IVB6240]UXR73172.1 rhodanese-like domain-containing protein [Staphylococcus sp. IVB6238]UXR75468.1 rhodanese-like domain-containing protein [Staphylococcus sp. IVB6233]UXR79671.1 rhodanese-like domain-containing protein [Staphylococcus sp. IVB6218]